MRKSVVLVGLLAGAGVLGLTAYWMTGGSPALAQGEISINPDDIGGTVTGPRGPEAGVPHVSGV